MPGSKSVLAALWGLGETVKDRAGLLLQLANLRDAAGKRTNQHAGEGERHAACR